MTKLSRDELLRFPIGKAVKTYTLVSSNGDCQTDHGALIPLGSGGSGVVYRAIQTLHADATIHRAVKFFLYADPIAELTAHRYSGPVSAADFLAEIANIISFNHEHLLRVIDAGIADVDGVDIPFLVTEFIEGPTLRDLVDNLANGNAATARVRADLQDHPTLGLEILLRVALGLAHVHQRGFAHCDIAPKNIFLSVEGTYRPVIGDLGIAKNLRRERHEVLLAGSKRYSPPDVVDRLNLVIPWSEFLSYQPRWDIVGFGKTGKEFLSLVVPDRLPQWYRPLLAMLEDCCEYRTYLSVEQVVAYLQFLQPVHRETAAVRELSTSLQGVTRRLIPVEPVLVTDRFRPLTYHPALLRLARVPQLTTFSRAAATRGTSIHLGFWRMFASTCSH